VSDLLDPAQHPTISVEEAARILGLGRSKAYAQARLYLATSGAEGLPVLEFGRSLRVPTAALRRLLLIDGPVREPLLAPTQIADQLTVLRGGRS
jgi:hypothetical protein